MSYLIVGSCGWSRVWLRRATEAEALACVRSFLECEGWSAKISKVWVA